ncbi:uncharacterized protein [Euphorbia lathyris]|uniref:uncharacterized protein isoform X3 n=1 Tax=Euphorbia lathyris TaxID=212925 RepID=UPI0033142116
MDFHSLKRKQLQSLCKKHGIPANKTNLQMADLLTAALKEKENTVLEEHINLKISEDEQKNFKKVRFSPDIETREYEPSGNKRKRRTTTLISSSLNESKKSIVSHKVGNKKGRRNGKIGSASRTRRTESEIETDNCNEGCESTAFQKGVANANIDRDGGETRKGARRSARIRAKCKDSELVLEADGGEAQSVVSISAVEGKDEVFGAIFRKTSKGIARAVSKRKSVDVPVESRQLVPKESRKRRKTMNLDVVTEDRASSETNEQNEKAPPPAANPRMSRRKTIVLNPNVAAEESASDEAMVKLKLLHEKALPKNYIVKELRRSNRRASVYSGAAMSIEVNEIAGIVAEVKEISPSVQKTETTAVVSESLVSKPSGASARHASKMKQKAIAGVPNLVETKHGGQNSNFTEKMLAEEETSTNKEVYCGSDDISGHSAEVDRIDIQKDGVYVLERHANTEDEFENELIPENGRSLESVNLDIVTESIKNVFHIDDVNDPPTEVGRSLEEDGVISGLERNNHDGTVGEKQHGQPGQEALHRKASLVDDEVYTKNLDDVSPFIGKKTDAVGDSSCIESEALELNLFFQEGESVFEKPCVEGSSINLTSMDGGKLLENAVTDMSSTQVAEEPSNLKQTHTTDIIAEQSQEPTEQLEEITKNGAKMVDQYHKFTTPVNQDSTAGEGKSCELQLASPKEISPHLENEVEAPNTKDSFQADCKTFLHLEKDNIQAAEDKETVALGEYACDASELKGSNDKAELEDDQVTARCSSDGEETDVSEGTEADTLPLLFMDDLEDKKVSYIAVPKNSSDEICEKDLGVGMICDREVGDGNGGEPFLPVATEISSCANSYCGRPEMELHHSFTQSNEKASYVCQAQIEEDEIMIRGDGRVHKSDDVANNPTHNPSLGNYEKDHDDVANEQLKLLSDAFGEGFFIDDVLDELSCENKTEVQPIEAGREQCLPERNKVVTVANSELTADSKNLDSISPFRGKIGDGLETEAFELNLCFEKGEYTAEKQDVEASPVNLISMDAGSIPENDSSTISAEEASNLKREYTANSIGEELQDVTEQFEEKTQAVMVDQSHAFTASKVHEGVTAEEGKSCEFKLLSAEKTSPGPENDTHNVQLESTYSVMKRTSKSGLIRSTAQKLADPNSMKGNSDDISGHSVEVDRINIQNDVVYFLGRHANIEDEIENKLKPENGRTLQSVNVEIVTENIKDVFQSDDVNDRLTEVARTIEDDGVILGLKRNEHDGTVDEEEHGQPGQEAHPRKASLVVGAENFMENTEDIPEGANEYSNEMQRNHVENFIVCGQERTEHDGVQLEVEAPNTKDSFQADCKTFLHLQKDNIQAAGDREIVALGGNAYNASELTGSNFKAELGDGKDQETTKFSFNGEENDVPERTQAGALPQFCIDAFEDGKVSYTAVPKKSSDEICGKDIGDGMICDREIGEQFLSETTEISSGADSYCGRPEMELHHSFTQPNGKASYVCQTLEVDEIITRGDGRVHQPTDSPSLGNDARDHDRVANEQLNVHLDALSKEVFIYNTGFLNDLPCENNLEIQPIEAGREQCLPQHSDEVVTDANCEQTPDTKTLDAVFPSKGNTTDAVGESSCHESEYFELNLFFEEGEHVKQNVEASPLNLLSMDAESFPENVSSTLIAEEASNVKRGYTVNSTVEELLEVTRQFEEMKNIEAVIVDHSHALTACAVHQEFKIEEGKRCELKLPSSKETGADHENDKHNVHCETPFSVTKRTNRSGLVPSTAQSANAMNDNGDDIQKDGVYVPGSHANMEDEIENELINGRSLHAVNVEIDTESIKDVSQRDDVNYWLTDVARSIEDYAMISGLERNKHDGTIGEEEHGQPGQEAHHRKASLVVVGTETIVADTEDMPDGANEYSNKMQEKDMNRGQHDFASGEALPYQETTRFSFNCEENDVLEGTQADAAPHSFIDELEDGKVSDIVQKNSSDEICDRDPGHGMISDREVGECNGGELFLSEATEISSCADSYCEEFDGRNYNKR